MAVSDGKVQFEDADANQIEVDLPVFPYKSNIIFPFDIQKLENGKYASYDHGVGAATYDHRICECTFQLTEAEAIIFNDFFRDDYTAAPETKGRAFDVTMRMNASSGFFPFGPDKGDVGDFVVALEIKSHARIGESPYLYFSITVNITNVGSWPVYSLPAEVAEGEMTIGTITNNRFPPDWIKS
ncbi:unnamed protein product, partial [marine sediment metagenome]